MNTFKQSYSQNIGRNIALGIIIGGLFTFSALVTAASTGLQTNNNNILGENPEHQN